MFATVWLAMAFFSVPASARTMLPDDGSPGSHTYLGSATPVGSIAPNCSQGTEYFTTEDGVNAGRCNAFGTESIQGDAPLGATAESREPLSRDPLVSTPAAQDLFLTDPWNSIDGQVNSRKLEEGTLRGMRLDAIAAMADMYDEERGFLQKLDESETRATLKNIYTTLKEFNAAFGGVTAGENQTDFADRTMARDFAVRRIDDGDKIAIKPLRDMLLELLDSHPVLAGLMAMFALASMAFSGRR